MSNVFQDGTTSHDVWVSALQSPIERIIEKLGTIVDTSLYTLTLATAGTETVLARCMLFTLMLVSYANLPIMKQGCAKTLV